MTVSHEAGALIDRLDLAPHPEGGWYRETWRAPALGDARPSATAILFLLDSGERSHWHRVDAAELWLWHAGSPLRLLTASCDAGPVEEIVLGGNVIEQQISQQVIAADHWQSTETIDGWALVSCVVSPGFDFAGFTMAPTGWWPGRF